MKKTLRHAAAVWWGFHNLHPDWLNASFHSPNVTKIEPLVEEKKKVAIFLHTLLLLFLFNYLVCKHGTFFKHINNKIILVMDLIKRFFFQLSAHFYSNERLYISLSSLGEGCGFHHRWLCPLDLTLRIMALSKHSRYYKYIYLFHIPEGFDILDFFVLPCKRH